jgi:predicted transposase YdaD
MNDWSSYDGVVKDLFQRDKPTLLGELAGPRKVRAFLNVELAAVEKRVADLFVLLSDDSILHLDFQSGNDPDMAYRVGIYGLMAAQKYRRRIRSVVLYIGQPKLRMEDRLDTGDIQVKYRLLDIRELDAKALLAGGHPGDYALAMLAKGGIGLLRELVERANRLPGPTRRRVLTQMVVLSGLRGASERLTMEFKTMGISIEIEKNVFLREIRDNARAEGRTEGRTGILRELVENKFGALPKWAAERLAKATPAQTERWARKILTATSIEAVLGPK